MRGVDEEACAITVTPIRDPHGLARLAKCIWHSRLVSTGRSLAGGARCAKWRVTGTRAPLCGTRLAKVMLQTDTSCKNSALLNPSRLLIHPGPSADSSCAVFLVLKH